ncbi:MAG: response regulator transcription factor [Chloroflexota bacterium]|nr:MAG: response regulator transcription factor [Chloroflexota bacterium]
MPIRVYLCDDHAMLRAGLRALLGDERGIEVIGEAGDGRTAVAEVVALRPDVAIFDITMPGIDGLEATRRVHRSVPEVRVLILTMHDDPAYLFQALDAGAAGYVLKRSAESDLIEAIRTIVVDNAFLAPAAASALVSDYVRRRDRGEIHEPIERLTAREEDVLKLIAQGFTNVEIADRLVISIKTVETHRAHILGKLGMRKRAELVEYARTHGLIAPGGL